MARILTIFMLISTASLLAQVPKPGPEEYTITVHVRSSRLTTECSSDPHGSSCQTLEELKVLIDGKKHKLTGQFGTFEKPRVLRVGEYKARLVNEDAERPYEYTRTYEFRFSDGRTRRFTVEGESE
jgi:hypothetical protein